MTNEKEVDISDLSEHFERWMNQPWPKTVMTDRQKLWLAFKAGGEWAIAEIRKNAGLPDSKAALDQTHGK